LYDLKLKMWLERDGSFIISDGRAKLLRKIKDTGSLSKAAKDMDMSYRHAWGILKRISDNAGGSVVKSTRGGKEGGLTSLTHLGEEILREYEHKASSLQSQVEHQWKKPSVTADAIIAKEDRIVLIRRGHEPFKGQYALPGGFLNYGERLEQCVVREAQEETGLKTEIVDLVGVYSSPDRDPRGHFVTAVYHLRPTGGTLRPGDDASAAEWFALDNLPEFAFDHGRIVQDFISRKKGKAGK